MFIFPSPYDKILPDQIQLQKTPDSHHKDDVCNRIIGSLVGLAIGDALGASVEFRPQQYLVAHPVTKMEGGGTWGLDAGKWTDDTSMALCLASSLIAENAFNPYNHMVRYKWWHKHGYFSSTGHCFDIGQATRQSIKEFALRQETLKTFYRCRSEYEVDTLTWDSVERIKDFHLDCSDQDSAGNGALMRLAPVPLFYFKTPNIAVEYAGRSASLTHSSKKAIDACRYYGALIVAALHGYTKKEILAGNFYSAHKHWFGEEPLHHDIQSIAEGSFKKTGGYEDGIRGKGYVVNALEAALWAFWSDGDSFEKGALAAVNLGDDTDTTAAIYGQLAGAYYSYEKIPKEWLKDLYARKLIICMSEWLHFQGSRRGMEESRQHPTTSVSLNTETSKPDEPNKHQTLIASVISKPDESKYSEVNHKYNDNMRHSKGQVPGNESSSRDSSNRSLPSDSTTDKSTHRITSPHDVDLHLENYNLSPRTTDQHDYTKKAYDHPFYRDNPRHKDFS